MTKTFAQIESTLPHSRKIRLLNHGERWAYLCAHLTPLGGFIGLFRYPKTVWADDASLQPKELDTAIKKMAEVGLVVFDQDEHFVRVVGWFLKKNAPENASRMASLAADFSDLDAPDEFILASAAEFTVGSIKRAQRWKSDSTEWGKLRDVFKPFLATMRQNYEDDFHHALSDQLVGQNRTVKAELCSIMPSLQSYLETPCSHPDHTVGAHDTKTRRDGNNTEIRKDEIYTAQFDGQNLEGQVVSSWANVSDAERREVLKGPLPQTLLAAKRLGTI